VAKALLAIAEIGEAEVGRWRELAAAALEPNPFFEPEFVLPAAAALRGDPALLIATDAAGEWTGAMPVVAGRGWRGMPLRGLASWRHDYSFFGAPLVRGDCAQAVFEDWLGEGEPSPRPYLGLDLLDPDRPLYAALRAACAEIGAAPVIFEEHDRAALRRGEDGLTMSLSPKRRRENARLGRRLGEALGEEVQALDRGADPAAVEAFLELEQAGWKGAEGTALASDPSHAELFRRLCDGFRAAGRLQMLCLQAGGRPAAIKCDLFAGDAVYCFKTCFDESLAEFSPGVQLERALVDHEKDNERVSLIDTCAEAGNERANRVWPDRRRMVSLAVPSPGLGATLSRVAVRASAKTRKLIRRTS
jgi:CelD/BcsL family acetyltransferase involved in cellulose biosynthesis